MFWGFCGTFFFIPVVTSPAVIMSLLTLSLWIFSGKCIKDWQLFLKQGWFSPVLLFMILPWIGLFYTNDIQNGLQFTQKSHYWLLAFAITSLTFQKYQTKTLMNAFLFGLSLIAVICILQFAGIIPKTKGYQIGFINSITYIHLLVLGMLLLSFYFHKTQKIKQRILFGCGLLLFCFNIFLFIGAPGRTAYLSFILLTPFMIYNLLGKRHLLKIAAIGLIIMTALFFSPIVQDTLKDTKAQIQSYYEGNPNTPVGLRLHMWNGAIRIFLENPVIGVGTGGYKIAMKKYETPQLLPECREFNQPHNSFLYMAVSYGIFGLISIFWLLFVFLRRGWIHRDKLVGFAILLFGMILVIGSLTDTQIIQVHTAMVFAILTGLQKTLDETINPPIPPLLKGGEGGLSGFSK
jgi:O-antigen ligase